MTGGKLESRDVALAARGVDSIAFHCKRKAEPQWHLGASHVGRSRCDRRARSPARWQVSPAYQDPWSLEQAASASRQAMTMKRRIGLFCSGGDVRRGFIRDEVADLQIKSLRIDGSAGIRGARGTVLFECRCEVLLGLEASPLTS